jgi:hypothetical protein
LLQNTGLSIKESSTFSDHGNSSFLEKVRAFTVFLQIDFDGYAR